jgi:DNA helicase-2/ATP-dependent DNA helicase PcrA
MVNLIHNRFPHIRRKDPIELPDELVKEILPAGDFHLQEERRLFYVGMTRAKERLYLTSAQDYGGIRTRKVSPFVLEALDRPQIDEINIRTKAQEKIERFAQPPGGKQQGLSQIPEEQILSLSHFQVDDYLTCPLKYKYVHILRVPILPHHTVIYGKALHSAVEFYHRQKLAGIPVTLDNLIRLFEETWRSEGFLSREHEERRFKTGKAALQQFFEKEEASHVVPKLIEERFSFLIENNRINGRWDRVDERDGQVVIIDFKSSEVHQQEAADKRTKDSLQLAIYAMAYQQTYHKLPDCVELHFLESGLVGSSPVTDKMLSKTEEKIQQAAAGIRKRDYTANPNYQACRFCAYVELCPSAMRS